MREALAIVGVGCRFPGGVKTVSQFWQLLTDGRDAITEVPKDRWSLPSFYSENRQASGRMQTPYGGFLDAIEDFDAEFFNISPREARHIDPQHRWLLEVAWEALEDSGTPPEKLAGEAVGVYVGISSNDYATIQMFGRSSVDLHTNSGSAISIAANRISHAFDFRGPSFSVDTACSSSLMAVHLACESIWNNESKLALVGGVNALLTPDLTIGFSKASMLSPHGKCRAFDAAADGYVRAEGAALVLIKPLSQALADGDRIYAEIIATATNQDGHTSSLTVPSEQAQQEMLRDVYSKAEVKPCDVSYVEAHGTGTQIGDPIEAHALGSVFSVDRKEPLQIGSVKTNIGHLECASGIAGLIKTALILKNKTLVPNLHFTNPSPNIDFRTLKLRVPIFAEELDSDSPLVAGVNSFGFGGSNAHVVLRETKQTVKAPSDSNRSSYLLPNYILPVSARNPEALSEYIAGYKKCLEEDKNLSLLDFCASAALRKSDHSYRKAVVGKDSADLLEKLSNPATVSRKKGKLAFIFSGQGPQYWGMASDLLESESIFSESLKICAKHFDQLAGWSLLDQLRANEDLSRLDQTEVAQPAIFALQVGLAALWRSWGFEPEAVIGHSVGEVAAAYVSGALSLEDAVKVVYHRSRLQQRSHGSGAMLVVALSEEQLLPLIKENQIEIAAYNSPSLITLSGDSEAIKLLSEELEDKGEYVRSLGVDYAFHSYQMDPLKEELIDSLSELSPVVPRIPFFSTVSGKRAEHLDNQYWWQNLRSPVCFKQALEALDGFDTFLELSPHPVLARPILETTSKSAPFVAASLKRDEQDLETLQENLARLYERGCKVNWNACYPSETSFLELPHYPWQKKHYWQESKESRLRRLSDPVHPLLGFKLSGVACGWECEISRHDLSYLNDHQINNTVVFPAAAYVEMALAAVSQLGITARLKDLEFVSPLFFPKEGTVQIQTIIIEQKLEIYSRNSQQNDEWQLKAKAQLSPLPPRKVKDLATEDLFSDGLETVSHETLYTSFEDAGYHFGPAFRLIDNITTLSEDKARGSIAIESEIEKEGHLFHPTLIDACFQCVRALQSDEDNADLYLPIGIEEATLYHDDFRSLRCIATVNQHGFEKLNADLQVFDQDARLVASFKGFSCQKIKRKRSSEALYHRNLWRDKPREVAESLDFNERSYLIFADSKGFGESLATNIKEAGGLAQLVYRAETFLAEAEAIWGVNPENKDDLNTLFDSLKTTTVNSILYLWNLDHEIATSLSVNQSQIISSIVPLHISQFKLSRPELAKTSLIFISPSEETAALLSAPTIGFSRALRSEYPTQKVHTIEIDSCSDENLQLLLSELAQGCNEDELRFKEGVRSACRLTQCSLIDLTPLPLEYRQNGEVLPWRLEAAGDLDKLRLRQSDRDPLDPKEVEIQTISAGINFRDILKAMKLYPDDAPDSKCFGDECSGVVLRCGSEVEDLKPGDEVIALSPFTFQSIVKAKREFVFPKPEMLSYDQSATSAIAYLTACYSLEKIARLQKNEAVLIHSAAGGVGLAAVRVAKRIGAKVFATAGSEEKREWLSSQGVEFVMDSRSLEFVDELLEYTAGRGVDVVLNSLAGEYIPAGLSVLAPFGRFVELGKRDIYESRTIDLGVFKENITFSAVDLAKAFILCPEVISKITAEVLADIKRGELEPLPVKSYPISQVSQAFRFMAQAKHIGRVALSFTEKNLSILPANLTKPRLEAKASYLVVGGTSGFGLEVVKWLVDCGAKNLAILSRRGISPELTATLNSLAFKDVNLLVESGDVSNEADIQLLMERIKSELAPLRGIIHSAMVLDDALVPQFNVERFKSVLDPKMLGAWNLHTASLELELDFFVLFSSLSSLIGPPGQANYAAANTFLDVLADYRHAQGLPALCINWGPLSGAGYIHRNQDVSEYLKTAGVNPLTLEKALASLGELLNRKISQIGVFNIDWNKWVSLSGQSKKFTEVCKPAKRSLGRGMFKRKLLQSSLVEQQRLLSEYLCMRAARALGFEPDAIQADMLLSEIGLDSLMAFQMKLEIDEDLDIILDPTKLVEVPDIKSLADVILNILTSDAKSEQSEHNKQSEESRSEL
ncbi:MAG: type I polyketide synthase [Bdellovibrionota bacterium]